MRRKSIGKIARDRAGASSETSPAPTAAPIHILFDKGLLQLDDGMLLISKADLEVRPVRLTEIAQVSLHGEAGITTPALRALMNRGIPVMFRARSGHYAGQTFDLSTQHTAVRRAQYRATEDPIQTLAFARAFVSAKLENARIFLLRHGADPSTPRSVGRLAQRANKAGSLDKLRGIEGAGAAAYFSELGRLLPRTTGFTFDGRSRRPPADPFNALLSYLYAVMTGDCAAAALAAGLDPCVGFLHSERPGRPALALDLVEPLRPLVCDSIALSLVNHHEIAPADFSGDSRGGFRLSDAARRIVLAALERRLAESFHRSGDLRSAIVTNSASFAETLKSGKPYHPILVSVR